ncbi:MAG: YggS family pyridoxal phosphate-dependent enzyme [Deltaproteobacteria bacterium]|jgi:pyridoxal phosphate enzyme (YggS family)|nr:YggS family pyridoxal phosphate-dependent enzyme [Deltaproteobacteria bacterium]
MTILSPKEETELRQRFASVLARKQKAESGAAKDRISLLVAISKWHEAAKLAVIARVWRELAPDLPIIFAENYMQEALNKQAELNRLLQNEAELSIHWHFTGHLQSNKGRQLPGNFELLHTLDSLSLAQNLHQNLQKTLRGSERELPAPQKTLVQINIGEEQQKSGVLPDGAAAFVKSLLTYPAVAVQGLMCLPPLTEKAEDSRPYFIRLRQLRDSLEQELGLALPHLSMGMSQDFEVAIEEGATLIRVGTDIFGERHK